MCKHVTCDKRCPEGAKPSAGSKETQLRTHLVSDDSSTYIAAAGRRAHTAACSDTSSADMSLKLGGNIFVTGTNRGIGLELVKQLAEKTPEDTRIYAGCRVPDGSNAQVGLTAPGVRPHPASLIKTTSVSVTEGAKPRCGSAGSTETRLVLRHLPVSAPDVTLVHSPQRPDRQGRGRLLMQHRAEDLGDPQGSSVVGSLMGRARLSHRWYRWSVCRPRLRPSCTF